METLSAETAYPIRTDIPLTVVIPASGPYESYATLHATGCSHTHRRLLREPYAFAGIEAYGADDFFQVAPCARSSKVRSKLRINS